MWRTIAKHESCINSCFAIVVHIVRCCTNLLPVTTMMLVSRFILRVSLLYPVYYEISGPLRSNSWFALLPILNTTTMILCGYFIDNSITRPKSMLVVVFRIRNKGNRLFSHVFVIQWNTAVKRLRMCRCVISCSRLWAKVWGFRTCKIDMCQRVIAFLIKITIGQVSLKC